MGRGSAGGLIQRPSKHFPELIFTLRYVVSTFPR